MLVSADHGLQMDDGGGSGSGMSQRAVQRAHELISHDQGILSLVMTGETDLTCGVRDGRLCCGRWTLGAVAGRRLLLGRIIMRTWAVTNYARARREELRAYFIVAAGGRALLPSAMVGTAVGAEHWAPSLLGAACWSDADHASAAVHARARKYAARRISSWPRTGR